MFRKALAAWLVVLALSPFTAPFSTCDLSTLLPNGATSSGRGATLVLTAPAIDIASADADALSTPRTRTRVEASTAFAVNPVGAAAHTPAGRAAGPPQRLWRLPALPPAPLRI
jgi:hypothetical protein